MPRRRRAFSSRRPRSRSAPAAITVSPQRQRKRKAWQEESMLEAIKVVKEGSTISQAARDHAVPKTTLYDRVSGKVTHGTNPGPRPYLTREEEQELGTYLKHCAKVGYGKTSTPSTSRTPVSALQSSQSTPSTSRTPVSALQSTPSTSRTPVSALQSTPSTSRTPVSALQSTPSTSRTPVSALQSSQSTPSTSRTPVSALQSSQSTPSNSLSKYLSPPQSTPSLKGKEPPRARLLTIYASAVELMLEKERKKKEEAELKERRRKEREEAKKKKEEEQRRKSEERAKKAELKAKQKAQKEEERARKAEEKAKSKVSTGRKRGGSGDEPSIRQAKRARTDHSANEINQSECCVCFVDYDDDPSGKDWVECACGRWLHEDCADDCVIDEEGKERLCLICLNQLCK